MIDYDDAFHRMSDVSLAIFTRFAQAGAMIAAIGLLYAGGRMQFQGMLSFVELMSAFFMITGVVVNELVYHTISKMEIKQQEEDASIRKDLDTMEV